MPVTDDPVYKRAAKRQFYEDFCKYAKAPPLRRSIAALIDVSLVGIPSVYGFVLTGSYLLALPVVAYLLFRDALLEGSSVGKAAVGLTVVHKETLRPCTVRQSLIRNSLYATVCPVFLFFGMLIMGIGVMVLSLVFSVLLFTWSRINPLFFLGYDPDNGRTIPDSWAETYVLTPKEIAIILKLRRELEEGV